MLVKTERLTLRNWCESDRGDFAALNSDPDVMADLGGPIERTESDAKFDRFTASYAKHGFCRWVVEHRDGHFVGYVGIMPSPPSHPLGPHVDIGWRLARQAWGRGYATEAGRATLKDAFARLGFEEVLSYTSPDNTRSQAVMNQLGLLRQPSKDFSHSYDGTLWHGLVWSARPAMLRD